MEIDVRGMFEILKPVLKRKVPYAIRRHWKLENESRRRDGGQTERIQEMEGANGETDETEDEVFISCFSSSSQIDIGSRRIN